MAQVVLSPWPFLSHCRDSRGPAVPPGRGLQGERSSRATPPLCCHRTKVKPEFCGPTTSHRPPPPNPSQLSRAHAPPAPALSPTPRSRLPRGPHKALGSPAAESHRCHALGPCALSRAPCAFPSAPQQGWQKEEAGLIKASPGGGGASPQAASFSRPGSPRRGGDRATASQRVRPGAAAAAGTRSSASTRLWGQTLFSSSVELRLVRQRRPYPLPAPPRHRYPFGAAA